MIIAEEVQTRTKINCLGTSHLTSEWLCLLCTVYITWKLAAVEVNVPKLPKLIDAALQSYKRLTPTGISLTVVA